MNKRFTASRVPDSGIEALFGTEERWQAWLAVESALALIQADLGLIPWEAADAITAACRIERLDLGRIRQGIARTSHPLMPVNIDLANTRVPDGVATDLRAGAARYEQVIREAGGIDVQLLGKGAQSHKGNSNGA